MYSKNREIWIDNTKVIACILVVLGHFFQSMTKSNIVESNNILLWFDKTIYYFHVPLFFICSGYLYQQYSKVNSSGEWSKNIFKKIIALGIPYFTFSFATWLLKVLFPGGVNTKPEGLLYTFFVFPSSPYWYLFALFLIFVITPTFRNKKTALIGLVIAIVFKILNIFGIGSNIEAKAVSYILSNEIWFVIGIEMCIFDIVNILKSKKTLLIAVLTGVIFVIASIFEYRCGTNIFGIGFILGCMACFCVIAVIVFIFKDNRQNGFFGFMAKYTMPIFLMHTLFAATFRSVLLKGGINSAVVHIVLGISISFAGPVIAAWVMEKSKWLEIFIYPNKFIGKKR